MTTPTRTTDHAARLLGWQLSRFLGAVRLRELGTALGAEIQSLEDVAYKVLTEQLGALAVGAQLEKWGRLVKLARTSADDDIYRARLEVESLINCSCGGSRVVQEIVSRLVGAAVSYRQIGTAAYLLEYEVAAHSPQATRDDVDQALPRASCSGVGHVVSEATASTFRYSTGPGYNDGGYGALVTQTEGA